MFRKRKKILYRQSAIHWGMVSRYFIVGLMFVMLMLSVFVWWWGRSGTAAWPEIGPYRILEISMDESDKAVRVRIVELVPELQKARMLEIPLDLKIESYGFPGNYEVRGIVTLSQSEAGDLSLLKRSLEEALGLFINGIVVRQQTLPDANVITIHSCLFELLKTKQLTFFEWWTLFSLVQKLSPDVSLIQIESLTAFKKLADVDGQEYISLYVPGFDVWYEKNMPILSSQLREITVTVENTTLKEGRGATVSRLFEHQGFSVLNITDGMAVLSSEILVGNHVADNRAIIKVLSSMFAHIPVRIADISGYRSDLVIRIAHDW
jgi:hypothetical protein